MRLTAAPTREERAADEAEAEEAQCRGLGNRLLNHVGRRPELNEQLEGTGGERRRATDRSRQVSARTKCGRDDDRTVRAGAERSRGQVEQRRDG